ncbi:phage tail protein [Vibrio parahaemolyticus]|nr:phage tail protein [Vibrio parahaemolyticus]
MTQPPESQQQFGSILTILGENAEQNGKLQNKQITFTHIAIGDANDTYVQPSRDQTVLVNELARIEVNSVDVLQPTPDSVPILKVEAILPDDINDLIIREFAAVTEFNGQTYFHAVGNCARVYVPKPINNGGVSTPVTIEMTFVITSVDPIVEIDPNIVTASRNWVGDNFVNQESDIVLNNWPKDKVQYIAHRGAVTAYPENTLPAIYASQGVDAVEFDVQLSSDKHWVVMHDSTVDRTTDGTGPVNALTLAQLKALDAGSWKGEHHKNTRVPTLGEVLEVCKRLSLRPVIEVKLDSVDAEDRQNLIEQCLSILGNYEFSIACYSRTLLANFRKDDKRINLLSFLYNVDHDAVSDEMVSLKPIVVGIWYPNISNDEIVNKYKSKGLSVMTFTLGGMHQIRSALKKGVVGILSDTLVGVNK